MTTPARGDLIWLDFDPQAGREQAGHRPALVVSDSMFNELTGFSVVCPITNQVKGYAFEVPIPEGYPFTGVVLTDQFKSLDVSKRRIKIAGHIPDDEEFIQSVLRNIRSILA